MQCVHVCTLHTNTSMQVKLNKQWFPNNRQMLVCSSIGSCFVIMSIRFMHDESEGKFILQTCEIYVWHKLLISIFYRIGIPKIDTSRLCVWACVSCCLLTNNMICDLHKHIEAQVAPLMLVKLWMVRCDCNRCSKRHLDCILLIKFCSAFMTKERKTSTAIARMYVCGWCCCDCCFLHTQIFDCSNCIYIYSCDKHYWVLPLLFLCFSNAFPCYEIYYMKNGCTMKKKCFPI